MFRKILFPVDGSEFAEAAAAAAAGVVGVANAEVRLVLVHKPLPAVTEQSKADLIAWAQKGEEAYLEEARRRLFGPWGARASVSLLRGEPADCIARAARDFDADLVVMSTHGRGYPGRLWLGSVADRLVRMLSVPLLLFRPEPEAALPVLMVNRILVPLDQSEFSERILASAAALARLTGAELVLLTVVHIPFVGAPAPGPMVHAPALTDDLAAMAQEYVDREAAALRAQGLQARGLVTQAAEVTRAIAETAAAEQADVIALATHGASGIQRLMLGSVANRLLRTFRTPLLVAPPAEGPQQQSAGRARRSHAHAGT